MIEKKEDGSWRMSEHGLSFFTADHMSDLI